MCQRSPFGVETVHWTDVLVLDFKALLVVQIIGLNIPSFWVLEGPGHASDDCRGDLKSCCVLVGSSLAGGLDIQLRSVPIGILGMAVDEHAELVHSLNNLILQNLPFRFFWDNTSTKHIQSRHNSFWGGLVRIMHSWPVHDFAFFLNCEVVGNCC